MALSNLCLERETVMITALWKTFFGRLKTEMYYGFEDTLLLLRYFQRKKKNTLSITTTKEFNKKQNGYHL